MTGQFDPTHQKAAWPSTGNFCRGGAYNATLLGCESIAILPEGMSRERFQWLASVAGEVIATPGCESNVKEIFDKCWELRETRGNVVIFNQFDEYGNHLWHYHVTGRALEEVLSEESGERGRCAGFVSQTGSAGTIGAGDYLKERFPGSRIVAGEALQCPTLLMNGYGDHRIEGIGDKHSPLDPQRPEHRRGDGHRRRGLCEPGAPFQRTRRKGVSRPRGFGRIRDLSLLGISGIGNLFGNQIRKVLRTEGKRYRPDCAHGFHGSLWDTDRGDARVPGGYGPIHAAADYHRT